MKALVGSFNQEKALEKGLLRDCEIFANLRIAFVSSSRPRPRWHGGDGDIVTSVVAVAVSPRLAAAQVPGRA